MDSLLRNLAVNERASSVDAYQTMTSLIRTYDEAPEQDVLQKKTALLQKYIKRDLVVLDIPFDNLPSDERLSMGNLVLSALKVLVIVVWSPAYSPYLTDDFRAWSVDRAIRVLKEHVLPKASLLHYMHLLATQSFRPTIITPIRVQRILEALQELTEHITGKAVVSERLLVYQNLIQQSKQAMKSRAELWIKNLLSALGHPFKEVRTNALSAGTEACRACSTAGSLATVARAALAEVTGERTLSGSITNRLERLLIAKDEANQIPQIWTLVLLLCNGGQHTLDSWVELPDWLKLIQRCFNSSDMTVRTQAFLAWNRLYWIARPHEASEKVVSMLAKPAMVQLERTGNNQSSKGTRQAVISSYCMLMYYAFRPSASPPQYTRMWNEFVVKLMTRSFLSRSGSNCDLSCRILSALFYSSMSKSRVWNENRGNENAALDPLELPAIDCKWVRSKTASILSIFQLVVDYSSFGPSGTISEQAYAAQAWRNLMRAIKESTSKEITPSADTKLALSSIVKFLKPVIGDDESSVGTAAEKSRKLNLLAKLAIEELGLSSMLQATENSTDPVNTILTRNLIQYLSKAGDGEFSQSLTKDQVFNRCLSILDADLEFVGRADPASRTFDSSLVFESTRHIIEELEVGQLFPALSKLQNSIVRIFEDVDKQFPKDDDLENNPTQYRMFCLGTLRFINTLESIQQTDLGRIKSAADSSDHAWLRNYDLSPPNESPQYEPHPEEIVAQCTSHVEIDPKPSPDIQNGELAQTVKSKPVRKSTSKGSESTSSKSRKNKKKPRHDDSQIEFVAVESSPPDYTFESQLLTTRQKEVRARQIAEPAITFANVRSSPSIGKKATPRLEKRPEQPRTPELPGTPTLPPPFQNEDEDQPPTPTPRTRKSRRLDMQPEITSSPPSVIGDSRDGPNINITSSPVKDVTEADDAVSFEEVDNRAVVDDPMEDVMISEEVGEQTAVEDQRDLSAKTPDVTADEDHSAPKGSTDEEYETAEPTRSSPTTYSDEYDALAASQLSHSLEETSFITSRLDDESVPEPPRATRKRKSEQREGSSSKRQRRASIENNDIVESVAQADVQDDDIEDTIYVTVEKATPSSSRVTRARAAQEASDLSQMSQKSSASATPKARKSTGRRRGRPRKKPRTPSSRGSSQATQSQVTTASFDAMEDEPEKVDEEIFEVLDVADLPSLGSEVAETAESKNLHNSIEMPDDLDADNIPVQEDPPGTTTSTEPHPPIIEPQISALPPTIPSNIVNNLQTILDTLNNNPAIDTTALGVDLAAIHNLCFKIGLKAQELVSR